MNSMCLRLHMNSEFLPFIAWSYNLQSDTLSFYNFSKVWGDKYLTSNVQIINPATGQFEYIGKQYRYFTTAHGNSGFPRVRNLVLISARAPNYGIWRPL